MEAKDTTIRKTPCSSPLPELEVPMINTMVACLGVEHRKLSGLNMQLAYGATRLASDPGAFEANQKVLRVWDKIRQNLWPHLQIEDGLVSWGEAHHAMPGGLLDTLKNERQEMRKLIATVIDRADHPIQLAHATTEAYAFDTLGIQTFGIQGHAHCICMHSLLVNCQGRPCCYSTDFAVAKTGSCAGAY